jgi:hypothetical protein
MEKIIEEPHEHYIEEVHPVVIETSPCLRHPDPPKHLLYDREIIRKWRRLVLY